MCLLVRSYEYWVGIVLVFVDLFDFLCLNVVDNFVYGDVICR